MYFGFRFNDELYPRNVDGSLTQPPLTVYEEYEEELDWITFYLLKEGKPKLPERDKIEENLYTKDGVHILIETQGVNDILDNISDELLSRLIFFYKKNLKKIPLNFNQGFIGTLLLEIEDNKEIGGGTNFNKTLYNSERDCLDNVYLRIKFPFNKPIDDKKLKLVIWHELHHIYRYFRIFRLKNKKLEDKETERLEKYLSFRKYDESPNIVLKSLAKLQYLLEEDELYAEIDTLKQWVTDNKEVNNLNYRDFLLEMPGYKNLTALKDILSWFLFQINQSKENKSGIGFIISKKLYNGKYSPEDAIDKLFDRGNMLLLKGYKKFYRTLYYSLEKLKRIDDGTPKRELSVPESIDELIKASLKKTLL